MPRLSAARAPARFARRAEDLGLAPREFADAARGSRHAGEDPGVPQRHPHQPRDRRRDGAVGARGAAPAPRALHRGRDARGRALWVHGDPPLVMHLDCDQSDYPHVIALFRRHGAWGAISKTNGAPLRYRDPIYRTLRELALSYFHEYSNRRGHKTLRSYSMPFDMRRLDPARLGHLGEVVLGSARPARGAAPLPAHLAAPGEAARQARRVRAQGLEARRVSAARSCTPSRRTAARAVAAPRRAADAAAATTRCRATRRA